MEGMSEVEGQKLVKQAFAEKGVEKFWHPTKFRIGTDTTKTFRDPPDSSIRLTSGEIYFLDVGPIVDGHEADYGFTFQFGSNGSVKKIHTPMQRLRCGMPVGLLGRNKRFLVKPCYRWGEERPKKEGIV
jgi:Xaa-Pro aminopeptidase